jgi:hypothetical protein
MCPKLAEEEAVVVAGEAEGAAAEVGTAGPDALPVAEKL